MVTKVKLFFILTISSSLCDDLKGHFNLSFCYTNACIVRSILCSAVGIFYFLLINWSMDIHISILSSQVACKACTHLFVLIVVHMHTQKTQLASKMSVALS